MSGHQKCVYQIKGEDGLVVKFAKPVSYWKAIAELGRARDKRD
jgi:hypothetical protein